MEKKRKGKKAGVLCIGIICFLIILNWQGRGMQVQAAATSEKVSDAEADTNYRRKKQGLEDIPITEQRKEQSGQILYQAVSSEDIIPKMAVMTVKDEESGEEFEAELPLERKQYRNERWQDGFSFTATFHDYGADYYVFGDIIIPHREDKPDLVPAYEELLKAVELNPQEYRIERCGWKGAAYQNEQGVLCRDLLLSGQQKVWDCLAVYSGTVKMPDITGYQMRTVQESVDETGQETAEETEEAVKEAEQEMGMDPEPEDIWGKWKKRIKTGIQISISLFFLAAAVWGFRFLMKKAKESRTE